MYVKIVIFSRYKPFVRGSNPLGVVANEQAISNFNCSITFTFGQTTERVNMLVGPRFPLTDGRVLVSALLTLQLRSCNSLQAF